jgi:hypothetical protein
MLLTLAPALVAEEAADRTYWVYEGGWFARSKDKSWYEMNEEAFGKSKAPWDFQEVKRTKEYVELRDDSRKVSVRLSESLAEYLGDDDKDREWKPLTKGRWKRR